MEVILVIGGMGSGKSSATKALAGLGLATIDLDTMGHTALTWTFVKSQLREAFGDAIFSSYGEIDRAALARVAFASKEATEKLNSITHPHIFKALTSSLSQLECEECPAVVIESSSFTGQEDLRKLATHIVLVTAPLEQRVQRAVQAGWREQDVRARIAQQMTDEERGQFATVTFENNGTLEQLQQQVLSWWKQVMRQEKSNA